MMSTTALAWLASPAPMELVGGRMACVLFSETSGPSVGVNVYVEEAFLGIFSNGLVSVAHGSDAFLTFPSGRSYTGSLSSPDGAAAYMRLNADGSLLDFLSNFATEGVFVASGEGWKLEVGPLPNASSEIETLRDCIEELHLG